MNSLPFVLVLDVGMTVMNYYQGNYTWCAVFAFISGLVLGVLIMKEV